MFSGVLILEGKTLPLNKSTRVPLLETSLFHSKEPLNELPLPSHFQMQERKKASKQAASITKNKKTNQKMPLSIYRLPLSTIHFFTA